jgi:hypothetical protein
MSSTHVGLIPMSSKTWPGDVNIIHSRCTALYLAAGAGVGGWVSSGS